MVCDIENVSHLNTLYNHTADTKFPDVVFSLLLGDGVLSVILAFLTHSKYTSVTVLNYSVHTKAISNSIWIWFYIFSSMSSVVSSLDFWLNLSRNNDYNALFVIGWVAYVFAVLSLAFGIKYQWQYKNEAFNNLSGTAGNNERTPLLYQPNPKSLPSLLDVLLVGLVLVSSALVITAVSLGNKYDGLYWTGFGIFWSLRIIIIVMVIIIIHYKLQRNGPSTTVKCLLLLGVLLNTVFDIPPYIWIKCIFDKECYYYGIVSALILSHVIFFIALRAEFIRLKDVAKWRAAGHIDDLEKSGLRTPK